MAGVSFTIAGDDRLDAMLELLKPGQFRKAQAAGLKYGGRAGKTAAAKETSARYAIPSSRIKQDIRDPRMIGETTIEFRFARRPPGLINFSARQTKSGVTFAIFRGQRQSAPGAFIATGQGGNKQVFSRRGAARLPIQTWYGPSVGSVIMGDSRHGPQIREAVVERVNEQYLKGVERYLSSLARRR